MYSAVFIPTTTLQQNAVDVGALLQKIKYEPGQFEGLPDAKMVHSGLLPTRSQVGFYNSGKSSQRQEFSLPPCEHWHSATQ